MRLSIIIPVYNAEKYLKRCLESVLNQKYNDFELILINDGSTDNSSKICECYVTQYSCIKYIEQINKGAAAARNKGISLAKGDYIGFVDADDFIEDNFYIELMNIVLKKNIDVVISNIKLYSKKNEVSYFNNTIPANKIFNNKEVKTFVLKKYYDDYGSVIPSIWNKIYKRSFLNKNHLFLDETRIRAEDYWFNFYVFKEANSVYYIDHVYYHYFTGNEGSIMNTFRENEFEHFLRSRKELLEQNKNLQFRININTFNSAFIIHTNDNILNGLKKMGFIEGYYFVINIIKNKEFREALLTIPLKNLHTIVIRFFVKKNYWVLTYFIYYIWSLK